LVRDVRGARLTTVFPVRGGRCDRIAGHQRALHAPLNWSLDLTVQDADDVLDRPPPHRFVGQLPHSPTVMITAIWAAFHTTGAA
jgi:hypothetical protein